MVVVAEAVEIVGAEEGFLLVVEAQSSVVGAIVGRTAEEGFHDG